LPALDYNGTGDAIVRVKEAIDTLPTSGVLEIAGDEYAYTTITIADKEFNLSGTLSKDYSEDDAVYIKTTIRNLTVTGELTANGLKFKEIDIGDWNMDLSPSVDIAHGLTWGNIVMVAASIRADAEIGHAEPLTTAWISIGAGQFGETQGAIEWDATNVTLRRLASGTFDHTNYNSTSYNRGWIIIVYKA